MPGIVSNTLIGAVTGTHASRTTQHKNICHGAGIWLLSGAGRTIKNRPTRVGGTPTVGVGTMVIDINERLCLTRETRFGQDESSYELYVPIGFSAFVATASGGVPAIMTTEVKITSVAVEPGFIVTDWHGYEFDATHDNGKYYDIKVTVGSWIDGKLAGDVPFTWMCTVEVGNVLPIPV